MPLFRLHWKGELNDCFWKGVQSRLRNYRYTYVKKHKLHQLHTKKLENFWGRVYSSLLRPHFTAEGKRNYLGKGQITDMPMLNVHKMPEVRTKKTQKLFSGRGTTPSLDLTPTRETNEFFLERDTE